MNNDSNYIDYSKITLIIVIIFFVVSFFAIQCIQKVSYIDKKKGDIPVEIDNDSDDDYIIDDQTKVDLKTNEEEVKQNDNRENDSNKVVNKKSNKQKTTYSSRSANHVGEGNYQEQQTEDDGEVEYVVIKSKNIFSNKYFTGDVIAPGVDGTYDFEIINHRKSKVVYKVTATDINDNNINLQYRLKRGNEYVIGSDNSWVGISDVKIQNISLSSNNKHSYILEWRWPYDGGVDDIDTQVGENDSSKYILKISIYAEDA